MATTDYSVAIECAKMMLSQSMLKSPERFTGKVNTVGQLIKVYLEFVDDYYKTPEGKPSKEVINILYSLRTLAELYSTTGLENFGPLMLIQVRERMIAENIVRKTVNQRIGRVKRMFKWAVSMQYASAMIFAALRQL
jgi:hypothetical protein